MCILEGFLWRVFLLVLIEVSVDFKRSGVVNFEWKLRIFCVLFILGWWIGYD